MLKFKEFLIEVYHSLMKINKDSVEIHKNPSFSETSKLLHNSRLKELRGLITNNSVYLWDSYKAIHDDVKPHLNHEEPDMKSAHHIIISRLGIHHDYYRDDPKIEMVKQHPWVQNQNSHGRPVID